MKYLNKINVQNVFKLITMLNKDIIKELIQFSKRILLVLWQFYVHSRITKAMEDDLTGSEGTGIVFLLVTI